MSFIEKIRKNLGEDEKEDEPFIPDEFEHEIEDFFETPLSYDISLIRPQSMDDIVFVFNQIVDEGNPVIVDLGFLEEEKFDTYQIALEKIDFLRQEYDVESILLCKTSNQNIILLAPSRIEIVKNE